MMELEKEQAVVNLVKDAIIAYPDAPSFQSADQLARAVRLRDAA